MDRYGPGEPVAGDAVYNGTLDDAAYVVLLIRLAEPRGGRGYRRPMLFAAFTGDEKGLLGARWFVDHPTMPRSSLAADINLDQLRPIFPLKLLTVHALGDTTLGDDARAVAASMGIEVQPDPEPERNLLRRAINGRSSRRASPRPPLCSATGRGARATRCTGNGIVPAITDRRTISPSRSTGRRRSTSAASSMRLPGGWRMPLRRPHGMTAVP